MRVTYTPARALIAIILGLGLTVMGGCGGGGGAPGPGPGGNATISGVVRDAGTRVGVVAATVQIGSNSTFSGANGAFTLTDVPTGSQVLVAGAAGFKTATLSVNLVRGANNIGDILLDPSLVPGRGAVTGVARAAGAPVVGATAAIAGLTALSGLDGTFTLFNVPAGTYTLTLTSSDGSSQATRSPVVVTAGQTTNVGTIELGSGPPPPPF